MWSKAMDDTLKRLLDAEMKAQARVDEAMNEHDRIVSQAQEEVRQAEQRFSARIPEIQASFKDKANERADQSIAELNRRYDERRLQLEALAEERHKIATEEAISIILDPTRV